MIKIGILTLYYENYNYGGLLQSYALCNAIRKMGYDSKQISFKKERMQSGKALRLIKLIEEVSLTGTVKKILYKCNEKIINMTTANTIKKSINNGINIRKDSLERFMNEIPHTIVVDKNSINSLNVEFDTFITGSDQVWKPGVCCDEYFLKFAKKRKIAYAVSIGRNKLAKEDEKYIMGMAKTLDAISVREKETYLLLQRKQLDAKLVVDPTLLLDRSEWECFAEKYEIKEKYLFCYFLGISKRQREMATKYAKEHGLKIVTFPYLSGVVNNVDNSFGDYRIYDANPRQFVYLIQNAEYVFTDSFHATVFSSIFWKKFIVFEREEEKTMSGRIISLLEIYGASDRLVKDIQKIDQLSMYEDIFRNEKLQKLRKESLAFLEKNIS